MANYKLNEQMVAGMSEGDKEIMGETSMPSKQLSLSLFLSLSFSVFGGCGTFPTSIVL